MSYADKIQALLRWCQQQAEGYANVRVMNFTSSFRDGLAFCAILHRYRPDLVDFHSLRPGDWLQNNRLAFSTAESMGIPALLDAEDMEVPEKLSIITYVTYYNLNLQGKEKSGGPSVNLFEKGRPKAAPVAAPAKSLETVAAPVPAPARVPVRTPVVEQRITAPVRTPTAAPAASAASAALPAVPAATVNTRAASPCRSPKRLAAVCVQCGDPVFFLERHIEAGRLYHRQCHLEGRREQLHRASVAYRRRRLAEEPTAPEEPPAKTTASSISPPRAESPLPLPPTLQTLPSPAANVAAPSPPRSVSPLPPNLITLPEPPALSPRKRELPKQQGLAHSNARLAPPPEPKIAPEPQWQSTYSKPSVHAALDALKPAPLPSTSVSASMPTEPKTEQIGQHLPVEKSLYSLLPPSQSTWLKAQPSQPLTQPPAQPPFAPSSRPAVNSLGQKAQNARQQETQLQSPVLAQPSWQRTSQPKQPSSQPLGFKTQAPERDARPQTAPTLQPSSFEAPAEQQSTEAPLNPPEQSTWLKGSKAQLPLQSLLQPPLKGASHPTKMLKTERQEPTAPSEPQPPSQQFDLKSLKTENHGQPVPSKSQPNPPSQQQDRGQQRDTALQTGQRQASPGPLLQPASQASSQSTSRPSQPSSQPLSQIPSQSSSQPGWNKLQRGSQPQQPQVKTSVDHVESPSPLNSSNRKSQSPATAAPSLRIQPRRLPSSTPPPTSPPPLSDAEIISAVDGQSSRRVIRTEAPDEFEASEDIERELADINRLQVEVEQRGRELYELLKTADQTQNSAEENRLLADWINLVNERNQLCRKEMYLLRRSEERELELRHSVIEFDLRLVLSKTDWLRSEADHLHEKQLLADLKSVVDRRALITELIHESAQEEAEAEAELASALAEKLLRMRPAAAKEDKKKKKQREKKEQRQKGAKSKKGGK